MWFFAAELVPPAAPPPAPRAPPRGGPGGPREGGPVNDVFDERARAVQRDARIVPERVRPRRRPWGRRAGRQLISLTRTYHFKSFYKMEFLVRNASIESIRSMTHRIRETTIDMRDQWVRSLVQWASANGNVRELWLFGSRANGRTHAGSDVDLAICLAPPHGRHDWALGNYVASGDEWSRQLEAIVGRHVSLEAIKPGTDEDAIVREHGVRLWPPNT